MSYTPTTWQTGDVVTSAKLNKLEQGVASASSGESSIKAIPYVIYTALEPMGGGFVKGISINHDTEDVTYELYTFAEMKQIVGDDFGSHIFAYSLLDGNGGMTGRISTSTYSEVGEVIVLEDAFLSVPSTTDPLGYMTSTKLFLKSDNTVEAERHYWTFAIANDD